MTTTPGSPDQDRIPTTAARYASIVACRHFIDGEQVPCPPMCPRQGWPRSMFRLNWRGHYVLRRRYRKADDAD